MIIPERIEIIVSYRTYTSTVSLPITYQWKCSICGEINRESTTIKTKGQSMSVGRRVSNQAQNTAASTAQSQMNDIVGALFGEKCSFTQYRSLGLNRKCKNCSHKEPWAANNLQWLRNIFIRIGAIVLFIDAILFCFGVLMLLLGKDRTSAQLKTDIIGLLEMLGIAGLVIGGFFLYVYISANYADKKDRKISKLPRSSLPVLVMNGSPVIDYEATERIEAEKIAQSEAKKAEERKREEAEKRRKEEERTKQETEDSIKHTTPPSLEKPVQQKDTDTSKEMYSYSAADEIEKFKGLLDKGIITQEEFDAKKKQLLGL